MRLTVGPLPPAVYWRRRAVVLGAGLLFLIVLLYSCTGSGRSDGGRPKAGGSPSASSAAPPGAGGPVLTPQTGAPSVPASADPATTGPSPEITSNNPPPGTAAGSVDDGTCTDAEISVTSVARPVSVQRGMVVDLQLKIKNVSERTCSRNVGADLQEIFIKSGAEKVWSSDTCGKVQGSDVQSFTPDFERSYQVGWNGRDTTRCDDNGLAAGPFPPAGTYQVLARVGTKLSAPVKLTITG
ncbi:hypothetical protein F8271_08845 [Micromonospora sp. ALFpr18c]|uniref:hypothetical protein n=1 Tax=unclassified Micromonospora TaxID=2617518 RepID=UPI00124B74F9|nr:MULTISPECIES: hypothetical protein [unclassified Micromonospora]KAB1944587.1 hypothetical protein F8271_08845 [Micromonospora sp. ALFpr18c]MDG4761608.1 hypothetical protein [Micromonospora sp. WMMD710]